MNSAAKLAILVAMALIGAALPQTGGSQTPAAPAESQAPADSFTEQVAKSVLDRVAGGLQAHNLRQFMSAFDNTGANHPSFENEMQVVFDEYEVFRMRYHILQMSSQTPYYAMVNFELEASRGTPLALPDALSSSDATRRTSQVRFKFARHGKEWRIESFTPADFFNLP